MRSPDSGGVAKDIYMLYVRIIMLALEGKNKSLGPKI